MVYPSLTEVLALHSSIINEMGGLDGVLGIGYLEGALSHIQNDTYYPTFYEKLAHLIFACVKFHPFIDGNKRTAIHIALYFIYRNNALDANTSFPLLLEEVVLDLANGKLDKKGLLEWIQSHLCL
ncbi:hypothetical protein BKH46_09175 [Helicobacter sp. 12S02634-8]|uniref:type II toxin-antitoxin system death-on-curing family toxin n=1 Tax=Helicobacter sp. 12S02634-8 TaxID=1476199 RepID=UPI000BA6351B|nr:type II toxin-antitoxin system death-on-curing family toxin [Helicobacter sp. 12S02634-8]PAF45830.1 hypothetical protein BKH46_09175 [Helicobacter sp. 12S02634-8]